MAKYLLLWELNLDKAPDDAKERGAGWFALLETVKQDLKEGRDLDWGCFTGETKGYSIAERDTEVELVKDLQRFFPFVIFEVHPVMSVDQMAEVAKSLTE